MSITVMRRRGYALALAAAALGALTMLVGACKGADKQEQAATSAAAGANAAAGSSARPSGPKGVPRTPVTVQLNWVPEPEFGGFYAAAQQGLYADAGLAVRLEAGGAGVQTWKLVATGKVPFAIASADEILRARGKDADVVAVFAVYQRNPQGLLVHEASGVSSFEDIFTSGKIKRVAMEAGIAYGRFLKKKYGFDKVEVIQYGGNLSLFLQDPTMAQQCFVFAEPVSAAEQGVAVKTLSLADAGFNPYTAVVITSEAYLANNRPVVEAFVRATRAGWQAYLADPRATNEHIGTLNKAMTVAAMNMAADLQKTYIETDETKATYLGYMTEARWRELGEQLVELGEIKAVPDVSKLFVNLPPRS